MKNNHLSLFLAAALLTGVGTLIIDHHTAVAQSNTAGALRGVIKDKKTGETLVGATVVATSSVLQGEQVVITDENGLYFVDNLPPGTYTLTVFYNDAKFSRGNVLIQVGKQSVVNVPIDTSTGAGGETIVIQGNAPIVDQGSTKTGQTITKEYTENIPVGRTFGAVLGAAAGAQDDFYGSSFQGSTSVESTYIVEGLNTTDTAYGGISTNLPNEFIQETELITGGYNAEFGRSTGAVINVVTKQGSNEFHGSVFGYYTPGSLSAASDKVIREGQAIDTERNLNYAYDVGAEIGGPILKDKLWFHLGFNPAQRASKIDRIINQLTDAVDNVTGDPIPDGNADVDDATGFTITDEVGRSVLNTKFTTYFFTAKINGALSQNHQYQIAAWGNPRSYTDEFNLVSAPSRQLWNIEDGSYDGSVKWTSKFLDGKTQVDAVGGYHRGYNRELPIASRGGDEPVRFFNYIRALSDFAAFEDNIPAECQPTDPGTNFDNCPVNLYGIGGIGFTEKRTNDRMSGVVSITQRLHLGGYHTFKGGFEVEQTTYDADRGLTGGVQYRHSANGNWRRRTYLEFNPMGTVPCGGDANGDGMLDALCSEVQNLVANTKNMNLGAYLQDSWQIMPNLTVNAGLRWEQQTGYTAEFLHGQVTSTGYPIPDKAFELKNMFAPRIGVIYDPTQEGRSKIFGHWGRFYESMPMDINVRAFGGEILQTQNAPAATCPTTPPNIGVLDPMSADPATIAACPLGTATFLGGGVEYVAPGTKAQYLDELILGTEYEFLPNFKIGVNYVNRRLPNIIEDMSADSANHYIIGNPGADYSDLADELHAQAIAQGLDTNCIDADMTNDALCGQAFESEARSFNVSRIKFFDKPVRNYDAIQLTANQRFSKNALVIASYTFSREYGNFPGLFSTETNQLDPNLTSMYDLQDLMANRYGPMGLDRPHNLKFDGFYQFDLKTAGVVVLGASIRAQSGLPTNTLASHAVYGTRESYVLPRGVIERTPPTWTADIKATYGYKIGKNMRVDAFVDVFNVFNNQQTTDVEEQYTQFPMNPIVGGDSEDLRHGKGLDENTAVQTGTTPLKFKNFGNETAHQAPLSMRFGLRLTF